MDTKIIHMNKKQVNKISKSKGIRESEDRLGSRLERYLRRTEHGLKFQELLGYGRRKNI